MPRGIRRRPPRIPRPISPSPADNQSAQLAKALPGLNFEITAHDLGVDCLDKSTGQVLQTYEYKYDRPGDEQLKLKDIANKVVRVWLECTPGKVPIIWYNYTEAFEEADLGMERTIMLKYSIDNEWMDNHLDNFKKRTNWDQCKSRFAGRSHGRYTTNPELEAFGRRKSKIQLMSFVPVEVVDDGKIIPHARPSQPANTWKNRVKGKA